MSKPRHKPHTDDEIQALLVRLSSAYDVACKYDKQHVYVAKGEDPILSTALRDSLLVIEQLRDERNTAVFKLEQAQKDLRDAGGIMALGANQTESVYRELQNTVAALEAANRHGAEVSSRLATSEKECDQNHCHVRMLDDEKQRSADLEYRLDTIVTNVRRRCMKADRRVGQLSGIVAYCGVCGLNDVDDNLKHCPLPEPPT